MFQKYSLVVLALQVMYRSIGVPALQYVVLALDTGVETFHRCPTIVLALQVLKHFIRVPVFRKCSIIVIPL